MIEGQPYYGGTPARFSGVSSQTRSLAILAIERRWLSASGITPGTISVHWPLGVLDALGGILWRALVYLGNSL